MPSERELSKRKRSRAELECGQIQPINRDFGMLEDEFFQYVMKEFNF